MFLFLIKNNKEMKIIFKKIVKDSSGEIKLVCNDKEDFWHVYNLLRLGDIIVSQTLRKVINTTSTGSTSTKKIKTTIHLKIDKIEYDATSDDGENMIRVKGVNCKENKFISLGQSHTISLSVERPFTIIKNKWDIIDLDRIKIAANPAKTADLCVITMEYGLAHIVLITNSLTITKARIQKTIPRKRIGSSTRHDKGINKFYVLIVDGIARHIDFNVIKCIVLGSPSFIKNDFFKFMIDYCQKYNDKMEYKTILQNKNKFIFGNCSSGHKYSVKEILNNDEMIKKLGNTKANDEIKILDDFFKLLNHDESRAIYGLNYILKANDSQAIKILMITDELFRNNDVKERKKYVNVVENCKNNGAKVHIFSSMHSTGEQLKQITGIAAILRFPMPELLDMFDDDDDADSDAKDDDPSNDDNNSDDMGLLDDNGNKKTGQKYVK